MSHLSSPSSLANIKLEKVSRKERSKLKIIIFVDFVSRFSEKGQNFKSEK